MAGIVGSAHVALNKSCDHAEALYYLPLENAVLDPISSYLELEATQKPSPPHSAVGITKWAKVLLQAHLHCLLSSHVFMCGQE